MESPCIRCSKIGKTCCEDNTKVPITVGDIKELVSIGHRIEDFACAREYSEHDFDDDEAWYRETAVWINGMPYKLDLKKDGDRCIFLGNNGCLLGERRPAACRIFPFWVDASGKVILDYDNIGCHMKDLQISAEDCMEQIGESEESIIRHFNKIKNDDRKEYEELVHSLIRKPIVLKFATGGCGGART